MILPTLSSHFQNFFFISARVSAEGHGCSADIEKENGRWKVRQLLTSLKPASSSSLLRLPFSLSFSRSDCSDC